MVLFEGEIIRCPFRDHRPQLGQSTLVLHDRYGRNHRPRFRCIPCNQTFALGHGRLFFRSRLSPKKIVTVLSLLAMGQKHSDVAKIVDVNKNTVTRIKQEACTAKFRELEDFLRMVGVTRAANMPGYLSIMSYCNPAGSLSRYADAALANTSYPGSNFYQLYQAKHQISERTARILMEDYLLKLEREKARNANLPRFERR